MGIFIALFFLFCVCFTIWLLVYLSKELQSQQKAKLKPISSYRNPYSSRPRTTPTATLTNSIPRTVKAPDTFKPPKTLAPTPPRPHATPTVNRALQEKLLELVQGDQQVAARLLQHVRSTNPTRSEQWCWEKALWDLERDRR